MSWNGTPNDMNELPNRDNLFPREIANFLRVSLSKVYKLIQEGGMPSRRIGDQYRIPRKEFLDWYEKIDGGAERLSA